MEQNEIAVSFDSAPVYSHLQHRRIQPSSSSSNFVSPNSYTTMNQTPMVPTIPQSSSYPNLYANPAPGSSTALGPGSADMAFMTFPLGETQMGGYAPPPAMAGGYVGSSFSGNNFEDEPPLLEELGVNIPLIGQKMFSILNPIRINTDLHEDGDLSGPIMFCMLFGLFQLLAGKVHFGIILGWASLASLFLYSLFNFLIGVQSQRSITVDLYRCCSVVGYSLLPIVIFSAVALLLPAGNTAIVIALSAVIWSSRTCSTLLINLVPHAEEQRYLLAYACFVVYSSFILLVLF